MSYDTSEGLVANPSESDPDGSATVRAAVEALAHDGDTFDLPDGRTLHLTFQPDESSNVMEDGDWFGKLAWPGSANDYGYESRPDGFDGNAERLTPTQMRDAIWWEPPKDVPRGSEGFDALRRNLLDLLDYGYCGIVVELLDTETDVYGRRIVRDVQSLWGIEPFPDDAYVAEVVGELLAEMEL